MPLIDYQAEILKRRPDDWDGALPKFKDVPGSEYEVPTLIARDGVHPSIDAALGLLGGRPCAATVMPCATI